MLVGQQTWARQKAPAAIDCPCDNNLGSATGSAIVNKTAKALERKLAKLVTKKRRLDLANQVRLAELELVDLRRARTPRSTLTINNLPRHTQACTVSDVNEGPLRKKPRAVETYRKAPEPPCYKGKTHLEYLEFIPACDQVFNTRPDAYCNDRSKVIYAQ